MSIQIIDCSEIDVETNKNCQKKKKIIFKFQKK
jgi:hypothetical protein